ncbi:MAG: membrane protein [Nitrospirales bacterium]|nr:MAG: membrane protein [Nitrospirales bacterium]
MDSVTQLALGAAVGEATLGRKVGNKAIWWGGICGTIPDLDIFIPFNDPVTSFISHRSFSHSLVILALLTPCVAWVIRRIHPQYATNTRAWMALVYLAFSTHVLLDSFTAYGTQLFWPLSNHPIMWSTIFIIDPLYTTPLLLGVIGALVMSREKGLGHTVNTLGLILSALYLSWTIAAKWHVEHFVQERLAAQQISYTQILVQPTPINSLLWRVLIMEEEGYAEGFYSILNRPTDLQLIHYPSDRHFLDTLTDHEPVKGLHWFTQGFWGIRLQDNLIVISDLRMGMEPNYAFSFNIGENREAQIFPIASERRASTTNWGQVLRWVWKQIWEASGEDNAHPKK